MRKDTQYIHNSPTIVGGGLVVLDIIIYNGTKGPAFFAGGTCGNVLAGLAFLGWDSIPICRAGKDVAGRFMLQDLSNNGVDVRYIAEEEKILTPRIIEKLTSNGQYAKHNFLWHCPTCHLHLPRFRSPRLDYIDKILEKNIAPDVYFFDRVSPATLKLAKIFRERGSLIYFEPVNLKFNENLKEAVSLCHILKYAGCGKEADLSPKANDNFLKKFDSPSPLLTVKTLGANGLMYKLNSDLKWNYKKSIKPLELYDSCGAGDWCTVGLIFSLRDMASKKKIQIVDSLKYKHAINSSLQFAQALASLSCGFIGARGLSNLMSQEMALKIAYSLKKSNLSKDSFINKHNRKKEVHSKIRENLIGNTCPTCLNKI